MTNRNATDKSSTARKAAHDCAILGLALRSLTEVRKTQTTGWLRSVRPLNAPRKMQVSSAE
ncbi:MAG: hypothetical protein ACXIU7_00345 [Roseinatronobacter sp.]